MEEATPPGGSHASRAARPDLSSTQQTADPQNATGGGHTDLRTRSSTEGPLGGRSRWQPMVSLQDGHFNTMDTNTQYCGFTSG
ncbi:hypothetical protein EYF80_057308 [Liparis tanakae]|uniref:Uncharacterized protein n=1 Tax=Liparis tanakae TaxID=230148 RepID=A0A4Z2EUN2_9TELE|nr:hypothetical protein EYF80_057308 [Liparis tanakae]